LNNVCSRFARQSSVWTYLRAAPPLRPGLLFFVRPKKSNQKKCRPEWRDYSLASSALGPALSRRGFLPRGKGACIHACAPSGANPKPPVRGRAIRGVERQRQQQPWVSLGSTQPTDGWGLSMRPIFTIHAGEYLVGSYIEANLKELNVWIPAKDTGVDLLITDKRNHKVVSLQVKFSKDFNSTNDADIKELKSRGWWALKRSKIQNSTADIWVFVLYAFDQKKPVFVVIEPRELLKRLKRIHGNKSLYHIYFVITKGNKCWEARGLKKRDQYLVAQNHYSEARRDFTPSLNDWKAIRAAVRRLD